MNEKIPKPTTPFFDERTGLMARPWFLFFAELSGEDITEDDDILFWASLHT